MSIDSVRLGDIATFIRGITFKPGDVVPPGTPGAIQCMRTKNVQADLDLSDVWAVDERFVKRTEQILEAGDLLISSANSWNLVGKCSWIPELDAPSTFGGFVTALRGDSEVVDRRYLYHWFSQRDTQAVMRSFSRQTTNIANLDIGRCLELSCPLPPLAEQKRIATFLDQADTLRAKRRKTIALLDGLAQALFIEMFGDPEENHKEWRSCSLGELITTGPSNGLYKPAADYGRGVPILRIDSFQSGSLKNPSDWRLVDASPVEQDRFELSKGDIVINRVNSRSHLGKSVMVGDVPDGAVFESNMMRFRVDGDVALPLFVEQFMQTRYVRKQVLEAAKDAVNQSSINQRDVKELRIYVPPLKNQQEYVQRVATIRGHAEGHQAHLDTLNELFVSLEQRAFSGTLWDHGCEADAA
ncbi:restriction endonuclease subunit S [Streptomyces phaeochromogenes]